MNTLIGTLLMFIYSIILALPAHATNSYRQQVNQGNNLLTDGEHLWLEAEERQFSGIYTPVVDKQPTGAVILLHGRGLHPNWPQVIQPLRTRLPGKGWATLSLQMPVLQGDVPDEDYLPLFNEVPARIRAGLDFLSQRGHNNIILIGHGLGSNMGTDYLAGHPDPRIKAFVGIGMAGKRQPAEYLPLDNVAGLLQIRIPVLDIYGSYTYPAILESADRRAFAISVHQSSNFRSRQITIKGAEHSFQGHEDELLRATTHWMTEFTRIKQAQILPGTNNHIHKK